MSQPFFNQSDLIVQLRCGVMTVNENKNLFFLSGLFYIIKYKPLFRRIDLSIVDNEEPLVLQHYILP